MGKADTHLWFRGLSDPLGSLTMEEAESAIAEKIWSMGVGETDCDPLYVFINYRLSLVFVPEHTVDGDIELRVFSVFDDGGNFLQSTLYSRKDSEWTSKQT